MQRIIVYLTTQADLSKYQAKGSGEASRVEKRRSVVRTLMQTASVTQPAALALLPPSFRNAKSKPVHSYWIFNGFSTTADYATVLRLASSPQVANIYPDEIIELPPDENGADQGEPTVPPPTAQPDSSGLEWGLQKMNVDRVWDELGVDGHGVVVASIDSGVLWDHPALKERYRGWDGSQVEHKYSWFDVLHGKTEPYDDQGHGTHTMGSMVGSSLEGGSIGVAPGARWMSVKALDSHGSGMASDLLKAMEWILAPGGDPDLAPDVVSNSWGARTCEDTFRSAVKAWREAGIVAVFSNGNSGQGGESSVGAPACYPESLGVGATDREDHVAEFSSRGPSPLEVVKPNVCAPGVKIRSSLNNGQYGEKSGTSMSTPYTAGVVALMLSANPQLDGDGVDTLLEESAVDVGEPGQDNDSGWGRIDAYRAVKAAQRTAATPTPQGEYTPEATSTAPNTPTPWDEFTPAPTAWLPQTSTPEPTSWFGPFPTTTWPTSTPIPQATETPQPTPTTSGDGPPVQITPERNFAVLYDDSESVFHFDAGWKSIDDEQAWGDSQHVSSRPGAVFDLDFYGDNFTLVNTRAPEYGLLSVMVDDTFVGYVNLYAPAVARQQKWTAIPIPLGKHRLKVMHHSGGEVNIDAVIVYRRESIRLAAPLWIPPP